MPDPATDATRVAQLAGALYGLTLDRDTMQQVLAVAVTLPGGVDGLADQLFATDLAALSNADLARRVADNLRILPELAPQAERAVFDVLTATPDHRGQALSALLQAFSDAADSDAPFAREAFLFRQRVQHAVDVAASGALPDPGFAVGTPTALSPGTDRVSSSPVFDARVTGWSLGGTRTLQPEDTASSNTHRTWLDVTADNALGPLSLLSWQTGGSLVELRLQSRAADPAEPTPLQVLVSREVQRVELAGSQADVELQLSHGAYGRMPQEVQIALVDTAAGDVDHVLRFSELQLRDADPAALSLLLMETASATSTDPALRALPLRDHPFAGVVFQLGNETVVLRDLDTEPDAPLSFDAAQTYEQLLAAVRRLLTLPQHLEHWPALAHVTADFGDTFDIQIASGASAVGTSIVLHVAPDSGLAFGPARLISDFGIPGDESLIHGTTLGGWQRLEAPTARLVLDNAGQGGVGGRLVVGATDDDPLPGGIGRVDITVERASALSTIEGTRDDLKHVSIGNGLFDGSLSVLGQDGELGSPPGTERGFGFVDVRVIDLSALRGTARVDAHITPAALAKYGLDPLLGDGVQLLGGAADDQLLLQVDATVAAQALFTARIAAGAGDDQLHLHIAGDGPGPQGTVTVEGGAGDDRLELSAPASLRVRLLLEPGFGDDRVQGLDGNDRIDLSALGGIRHAGTRILEPAAGALQLQDGGIVLAPAGLATDDATGVASRFVDHGDAPAARQQVYIAFDTEGRGNIWQVDDPLGADNVVATLMGSLTLEGLAWTSLGADAFG